MGRRQLRIPDFPDVYAVDVGLALPVQLFDMGAGQEKVYGKGAAPLALRLFVESLLALKVKDRGRRVMFTVKLRDLLDRLYPNGRPSPAKYWPKLTEAAELISGNAARIPWYDYERRTGGQRGIFVVTHWGPPPFGIHSSSGPGK